MDRQAALVEWDRDHGVRVVFFMLHTCEKCCIRTSRLTNLFPVMSSGNSQLAMAQVNFAGRFKHPALKCIAPWEGVTDAYRQTSRRGGSPTLLAFNQMIIKGYAGQ
jgi:hypothetical protein